MLITTEKSLEKGVNDQDINKVVFTEIDKAIVKYLAGGYSVCVSNTNLHADKIKELAEKFPLNEVVVFFLKDSEDIELCWSRIQKDLENGKDRSNVPREVLEKQYQRYKSFDKEKLSKVENIIMYEINSSFRLIRV